MVYAGVSPSNILFNKKAINRALSISVILSVVLAFVFYLNSHKQVDNDETNVIIQSPKINDILFIDNRLMNLVRRPQEIYRIAKIIDITGNIVTLLYGDYFYQYHHAAIRSIGLGHLSFPAYFQKNRHNITKAELKKLSQTGVVYQAKRPVRGKLYGQSINPVSRKGTKNIYIYGVKENEKGEAFLRASHIDNYLSEAFHYFKKSAELGYFLGQLNLAEMYINGLSVDKDLSQAAYWLKQASLQSYEPAIHKYAIVCQQLSDCRVDSFYQELRELNIIK